MSLMLKFQFTHPCGCDVRGIQLYELISCFNSRTRVGATPIYSNYHPTMMFQFTHPCGCDGLTNTV